MEGLSVGCLSRLNFPAQREVYLMKMERFRNLFVLKFQWAAAGIYRLMSGSDPTTGLTSFGARLGLAQFESELGWVRSGAFQVSVFPLEPPSTSGETILNHLNVLTRIFYGRLCNFQPPI